MSPPFAPDSRAFDADKGIPPEARRAIATAVLGWADGVPGTVVEIGAGTGEIGARLAASGRPYAGLDVSRAMLARFGARSRGHAALVEADASRGWPVHASSAAVVFGSRVFHLLDAAHVAGEASRVLVPGGVLLAGRVSREPGSPREILRRSLGEALARRGVVRRDAREVAGPVERLVREGAGVLPRVVVARWVAARRPGASLETWRSRPGLPGAPDVAAREKAAVLDEVEAAFRAEFGDPDAPVHSRERFVLEGARLS